MLGGESHLFLSVPTRLGMGLSEVTAGEKPFPPALLSNRALPLLLSLFPSSHSSKETAPVHKACSPSWLLARGWCRVLWSNLESLPSEQSLWDWEQRKNKGTSIPQVLCMQTPKPYHKLRSGLGS